MENILNLPVNPVILSKSVLQTVKLDPSSASFFFLIMRLKKKKKTIHDLTGLVSFSPPAVWRAHSAVWRTEPVRRLRHDPHPPPPPVRNLRTGKCSWTLWTKTLFLYCYISICHHTATRLQSLKSFPSHILLLSHMSGFFFHTCI